LNPIPWIILVVASRILIAILSGVAATETAPDPCDDFLDIITGCDGFLGYIGSLLLGTLPGLPDEINVFLAIIGLAIDIWIIAAFVRGVSS